ncbi:hypothetical protein D3C85_1441490 [compost metagenome]
MGVDQDQVEMVFERRHQVGQAKPAVGSLQDKVDQMVVDVVGDHQRQIRDGGAGNDPGTVRHVEGEQVVDSALRFFK